MCVCGVCVGGEGVGAFPQTPRLPPSPKRERERERERKERTLPCFFFLQSNGTHAYHYWRNNFQLWKFCHSLGIQDSKYQCPKAQKFDDRAKDLINSIASCTINLIDFNPTHYTVSHDTRHLICWQSLIFFLIVLNSISRNLIP